HMWADNHTARKANKKQQIAINLRIKDIIAVIFQDYRNTMLPNGWKKYKKKWICFPFFQMMCL
ncbi:MAG: hypothetical protein ABJZ92_11415, partial [Cyclobacteriaceae bacterium]